MEKLKANIIARALLDYSSGLLNREWFWEQDLVHLNWNMVLERVMNPDVQARLEALLAE